MNKINPNLHIQHEERKKSTDIQKKSIFSATAPPLSNSQYLIEELTIYKAKLKRQKEELRQVYEELDKVKTIYSDLYDFAPVAYFTLGKDYSISMVNLVGAELIGIERSGLMGRIFSEYISNDRLKRFYRHINHCLQSGKKQSCELKLSANCNEEKHIHLESVAVADEKGHYNQIRMAIIDITDRKKADETIKELSRELLYSHEHERQMISRELHDSVAQELSAVKIGCDMIFDNYLEDPEGLKTRLSQLSKMLQKTTMAVRDLSYILRPPFLEQRDIIKTVSVFCSEFSEKTDIKVNFLSAGMGQIILDDFYAINIYRLVQEGLNNVKKHADASNVEVTLSYHKPHLLLRIVDNGKGFDVEKRQATLTSEKKMGLRSMQERVRLLSGTMNVESKPTFGTKIFIKLKLAEK